uniref:Uncharacterized protein n=1 Tax=Elphidium margaritaceum TaxID=933848 RepID=A0A7S0XMU2_9EUKA
MTTTSLELGKPLINNAGDADNTGRADNPVSTKHDLEDKLDDCKANENPEIMELYLDRDIYVFFLLIRQTRHYAKWTCVQRFKLQVLVFLCFFVQFFTVVCLIFNDYDTDDMGATTIECESGPPTVFVNGTFVESAPLHADDCTITESIREQIYFSYMDAWGYLVRICAIALVQCFLYPNVTSFAPFSIKLLQTRRWEWLMISLFQVLVLVAVGLYVVQIIYKSLSTLDVLSAGIGFIILLEVDAFLYQVVYRNIYENVEGDLFRIDLHKNDVPNTVFKTFTPDTYDMLLFLSTLFVQLFPSMMACSWFRMGLDADDFHDGVKFYIMVLSSFLPAAVFLFWPYVSVIFHGIYGCCGANNR